MKTNQTFTMIKPDAVGNGHIGAILNKIAEAGFSFKALKMTRLSQTAAEAFYARLGKCASKRNHGART